MSESMSPALEALAREVQQRLRSFIRRRVRSDAEADDVLQDVLAKLVERGADVSDASLQAWLWTVARRAVIDRARAARSREAAAEDFAADLSEYAAETPDESALRELAACTAPMLATLDREDRELLERVDLAGESQADLARALGLSSSGLKSRVQRARVKLREQFERCCVIERDVRGLPHEVRSRPGGPCGPSCGPCESA
jgi:RNA polymerase sigma-70 factor (ECF subfamily)